MPEIYHGGAESQFRILVENLDAERHSITVFVEGSYGRKMDQSAEQSWISKQQREKQVRFIFLDNLRTNDGHIRRLISAVRLGFYLVPYLLRREFDTVIVYSAIGLRLTPLLRLFRVFAVFSERNAAVYSRMDLLRKRAYFTSANAIVCNSLAASQNFSRYGYRPLVIENAVAPPPLVRSARAPRAAGQIVVVPGRIAPIKNQTLVARALPALDGIVSRVYFAGAVEDVEYLQQLKDLVASTGWCSRVDILGFVHDMDTLYADCDLVVLPSLAEGMPNVLLEALTREVPCVASDLASNRDVLRDDRLLFRVDDPSTLVKSILHLARLNQTDTRQLTIDQRQYVTTRFSVENLITGYERLFALARGGGGNGQ